MDKEINQIQRGFKLLVVMIVLLISVSLIFMSNCYVNAETVTISGTDGKASIFIATDDGLNFIIFENENGYSEHFDSKLKQYKSGGFSLKNFESGIIVFGHKITDQKYKLVVITSEKVHRLIGFIETLNDIVEEPILRIEPKSSIGSDVSKWNVPTTNPRSQPLEDLFGISANIPNTKLLNDKFHPTFKVFEVRKNKALKDIPVTLEISRDGIILDTRKGITGSGGLVTLKIDSLQYPLYYPKHCYDVKISATIGNSTAIKTDDMLIQYNGNWNPNTDWMNDSRWNYLPNSYKLEPRAIQPSDERCN